ncbi:MAG: Uma2 family endonuclease [Verrucomicrobia bacterium]|nr:Uma2 family endonuclease [Verrucomicrobiota bacterium]
MSEPYEEILAGETWLRLPPSSRHEEVCGRLHALVAKALAAPVGQELRLLPPRSMIELRAGTMLRPDMAVVNAEGKTLLVAEVIYPGDHQPDTVVKKAAYEESEVERLWMVDLRYNCVEVYERGPYGLALRRSLAGMDLLSEEFLPALELRIAELFEQ